MNKKQLLLYICIQLHSLSATSRDKSLRYIGGRDTAPGEFPYVMKMEAKLEKTNSDVSYHHLCTCSLLKPTWSLTAAHCIRQLEDTIRKVPIIKGVIRHNTSSNQESSFRSILLMFKQPNYKQFVYENDIGLLHSENIPVNSFIKLSSVDYLTLYGSKALAFGYGLTIGSNGSLGDAYSVNKTLQILDAIIIKCSIKILSPAFCLAGVCGLWPSARPGDSGGPVLHETGVVGICATVAGRKTKPHSKKLALEEVGQFTPVSGYIDWITNVINSIGY